MNQCRKIEPLIYLYRDGELPAAETSIVVEHARTCPKCREILGQLHSIDAALAPLRAGAPDISGDSALAEETINRITRRSLKKTLKSSSVGALDGFFAKLRPVLSVAVVAAVLLFGSQQSRDAVKVSFLEHRLQTQGNVALSTVPFSNTEALHLFEMVSLEQQRGASPSSSLRSAAVAGDPMKLFGSGLPGFFQHDRGLFEEFSRRYPSLSKIKLEDGIDENEKQILATEGKAFLRDFEQLLQQGEK